MPLSMKAKLKEVNAPLPETAKNGEPLKKNKKAVLIRLSGYFFRYKFRVLAAFLLIIGSNLFALLGPYLSGKAIDAISLKEGVDFDAVGKYCLLMAVFYVVSAVLSYLLSILMINLSQKIVRYMRREVFNKILSLPVGALDRVQAGDLINRISYDIDTVNASLSNDILQAATGIISVAGALFGMIATSPALLGVFIITLPISVMITIRRSRTVRPLFRKRSASLAQLNGFSEEMLTGLKTIRAYGREEKIMEKFRAKNNQAVDAYYDADYYGSLIGPAVNFVNNLGTVIISTAGAFFFLFGLISIGDISAFLLYSRKFSGPVNEYANIMGEIQSALAAAERVFRLLDAPSEPEDAPGAIEARDVKGEIRFRSVRFSYDGQTDIIKNLSFTALPGQTIAIVGPTGAGKTTVINLLMRFYDADSGSITVDGQEILSLTRASLRRAYSMVLQDTWLFSGTVYENLAYGKEGVTLEQVRAAARAAKIDRFIEALPQGYDTVLRDGGNSISKGQRQLLTIARAMLLDAPMLILDEATSNVDTRTERRIQAAMLRLMEGRTCFVIAHRLSTIRNADVIAVLREGTVAECGTHDELMRRGGYYSELYRAQFDAAQDAG